MSRLFVVGDVVRVTDRASDCWGRRGVVRQVMTQSQLAVQLDGFGTWQTLTFVAKSLSLLETTRIADSAVLPGDRGSRRILHVVTITEVAEKRLQLPFLPADPASVVITPRGFPSQFSGKDFAISNSNVSWDDYPDGLGLLAAGDVLVAESSCSQ